MKPRTREENFLAKIAGDASADSSMQPRTPEEYFLNEISGTPKLPASAAADAGKVLTVNESGAAAWAEASGGARPVVELTNANFLSDMTDKLTAVLTACTDSAMHIKKGVSMTGDEDLFNAIKSVYDTNCDVMVSMSVSGATLNTVPLSATTGVIGSETYYDVLFYTPIFFYYTNIYTISTRVYVNRGTDYYGFQVDMSGQKMTTIS